MNSFPFSKKNEASWMNIIGSIILLVILCYWTFQIFTQIQPKTLLAAADFPIHEYLGGMIFSLFGNDVFTAFGQNLTDVLVPLFFFFYFWHNRQYTSTTFCLFWMGENITGIGIYMTDAIKLQLTICSGWYAMCGSGSDTEAFHDWHIIFSAWDLLPESEIFGGIVHIIGILCIIASVIALGYIIWKRIDFKLQLQQAKIEQSTTGIEAKD